MTRPYHRNAVKQLEPMKRSPLFRRQRIAQ
jgi:hypothetical protein